MLTTLKSFSQDSTTCLPNRQLRIAIEKIKLGEQAQREVVLLRQNEAHWRDIVSERDSIISLLRSREATHAAIADGYTARLNLAEKQHQLTKDWASQLGVKLRKQRRKTLLWALGGIIATGSSIYLMR